MKTNTNLFLFIGSSSMVIITICASMALGIITPDNLSLSILVSFAALVFIASVIYIWRVI